MTLRWDLRGQCSLRMCTHGWTRRWRDGGIFMCLLFVCLMSSHMRLFICICLYVFVCACGCMNEWLATRDSRFQTQFHRVNAIMFMMVFVAPSGAVSHGLFHCIYHSSVVWQLWQCIVLHVGVRIVLLVLLWDICFCIVPNQFKMYICI